MIFLDLEDLMHIAERVIGDVEVRDPGLLEAAAARPRASAFGEDAYATLPDKAAALMHSVARSHPLVDGNKRLALAAGIAFLGMNAVRLTMSNDDAYDLIIAIATSRFEHVPDIARAMERHTAPRRP